MSGAAFDASAREAIYRVLFGRRDVRSYRPEPIDEAALRRVLEAAHAAPSVGLSQPWSFVLVRDPEVRRRVHAHFLEVNARAAREFEDDRAATYRALKLQGILDAPLNLLVTCDVAPAGPVLGRFSMPETSVYSTCLAIQNLWLAARAEGLGVGWMSLMEPAVIGPLFGLPEGVIPIAYLTMGVPVDLPETPLLERVGWKQRAPLESVVFADRYGARAYESTDAGSMPQPPAPRSPSAAAAAVEHRLTELTMPVGSLGRIGELAARIAYATGEAHPDVSRTTLLLFAGDHGVAKLGTSAYRPEATAMMVLQYLAGGGVVNALAREHGVRLEVIDVGVDHDFAGATALVDAKVARGTRPFDTEDAMGDDELARALEAGRDAVRRHADAAVLALGEMGIGNTASASAMLAALLGLSIDEAAGRGTGVDDARLATKKAILARGLARNPSTEPRAVLRAFGGFELAALVGAILEGCAGDRVVLLDGFLTQVAALVALRLEPTLDRGRLVASHRSAEAASARVLGELGLDPLLDLGLRLGEGSGALLALPLLRAACRILADARTYDESNLVRPIW